MIVVFQGGESPSHRDTLLSVKEMFDGPVPMAVSVSHTSIRRRRLGSKYLRSLAKMFPVVLEAGVSRSSISESAAVGAMSDYYSFLAENPEITYAVAFDHPAIESSLEDLPDDPRVLPVFSPDLELSRLTEFLKERSGVAIPFNGDLRIAPILRMHGSEGSFKISLAQPNLETARSNGFDAAMTQAWFAPGKYGEISVWDGAKFHRSSSKERPALLTRYEQFIAGAGFDIGLLEKGDARESDRLAAWSFLSWAVSMTEQSDKSEAESSSELAIETSVSITAEMANREKTRIRIDLPVFTRDVVESFEEHPDGTSGILPRSVLRSSGDPQRVCNSCYLSSTCPAFEADSSCAFKFPVEVRTNDQVKALLASMIELQAARVAFARFAEEVNGGYPDAVVGQEMDRLFRMSDRIKKFDDRRERLTVSVESESGGGGTGVLSKIFGRGSEPKPLGADMIIGEIIEGEVSDQ